MKPLCYTCRHLEAARSRGEDVLYCGRQITGAPDRMACEAWEREPGSDDE